MTTMQTAIDSVNHYVSKGVPKDGAVAIISCLWYESKLNPGSQGVQSTEHGGALNPHGAFGIASWNGPRQGVLADFAQKKGLDPSALNTQLDFVLTECANSYHGVWAAITSQAPYSQIIPIFVAQYENPADHQKEIDAALSFAKSIYSDSSIISHPVIPTPTVPTPATPIQILAPTPTQTQVTTVNPILVNLIATVVEAIFAALIKQLGTAPLPAAGTHTTPAAPIPAAPAIPILPSDPALAAILQQILAALAALSPPQGAK